MGGDPNHLLSGGPSSKLERKNAMNLTCHELERRTFPHRPDQKKTHTYPTQQQQRQQQQQHRGTSTCHEKCPRLSLVPTGSRFSSCLEILLLWKGSRPQKSNIPKNGHSLSRSHLFQTIMLGIHIIYIYIYIHVSFRGCTSSNRSRLAFQGSSRKYCRKFNTYTQKMRPL